MFTDTYVVYVDSEGRLYRPITSHETQLCSAICIEPLTMWLRWASSPLWGFTDKGSQHLGRQHYQKTWMAAGGAPISRWTVVLLGRITLRYTKHQDLTSSRCTALLLGGEPSVILNPSSPLGAASKSMPRRAGETSCLDCGWSLSSTQRTWGWAAESWSWGDTRVLVLKLGGQQSSWSWG
jgi:hypothetical protein